jgi:hypothetical protein
MKTLSINISDIEYNQLGLKDERISFTDFVDIINKELTKQALSKCLQLSDKYKLSKMSMDDISNEIKVVRNEKSSS